MYKLLGTIFTVLLFLLMASPAFSQDLTVEKKGKPDTVKVGDLITYTLSVNNPTATNDETGEIRDKLPEEVKFVGFRDEDAFATCTQDGRDITCDFTDVGANEEDSVKVIVQAQNTGDAKNTAQLFTNSSDTSENDSDSVTTHINKKDSSGGSDGSKTGKGNPPGDRNGDGFISQAEEALNAEEDLNSTESTDGESTDSSLEDSGTDVGANPDENGAEASTPGAVASANGDEDTSGPVGPQGDVVNDIPESGPLPNTGGVSLLALAMPVLGVMLLGATLIHRWRRVR